MRVNYVLLESSVEIDWGTEERVDDVRIVVQLLMNHQGEYSHLSSTAVVQFDRKLSLESRLIPTACFYLSILNLLLTRVETELDEANEGDDLSGTSGRNHVKCLQSRRDISKLGPKGNLSRQANARGRDEVAKDSKHRNAAMLSLNVAQTVEALLISIVEQPKRIPESERSLCTDFRLKTHSDLQGRSTSNARHRARGKSHCRKQINQKERSSEMKRHNCFANDSSHTEYS